LVIARVVLTSREHIIALEARDKGLMGMLLRYPYEVRAGSELSGWRLNSTPRRSREGTARL
jgi:non-homologous end joining protein Ku